MGGTGSGLNRKAGAPALPGAGRKPTTATLRAGSIVFVTQVWPAGVAHLGSGVVSKIEKLLGGDRCVVIPQTDGSELRIVITE